MGKGISIGRKIAEKVIKGSFFETGEYWPTNSTYHIRINEFKFFESQKDGTETFVVEAKCLKVITGGKASGDGDFKIRRVRAGDTRSQVIRLVREAAVGNVIQFVGVALGVLFQRDEPLTWQDPATVNKLLKKFGLKRYKKDDEAVRMSRLLEYLTGEDQPFSGLEMILSTRDKPTNKGGIFTLHWYELLVDEDEPDEDDDEYDDEEEDE